MNKINTSTNNHITVAFVALVIVCAGYLTVNNWNNFRITFFFGLASPQCDATTSCSATTIEGGVKKWCRNMNGDGYKWVVAQHCESGCPAGSINCQNNPVGISTQCGTETGKPTNKVCRDKKWQLPVCGDRLCTPELGENASTCLTDCPGVVVKTIDTTEYWPLQTGNYWIFDGVVTAANPPASTEAEKIDAKHGDTFSTVIFVEPKEIICGEEYNPIAFFKDKVNAYHTFGQIQNNRLFVSNFRIESNWNTEYLYAPAVKRYVRDPIDPFKHEQVIFAGHRRSAEPENYPPYIFLPKTLRIDKSLFARQDQLFIDRDFSTCEWMEKPDRVGPGQMWHMQFALVQTQTPAYNGETLQVRFDEKSSDGRLIAGEDWYFAKDIGVVRIHRYFDWIDPEGSSYYDLRLREYGNSVSPPMFIVDQPAIREKASICGITKSGSTNRTDATCASGDGLANGKSWTSSCSAKWKLDKNWQVTSCIYAFPSLSTSPDQVRKNRGWELTSDQPYTGWVDAYVVKSPVGSEIYKPAQVYMTDGIATMPTLGTSGTYILRYRPADDSASWSAKITITVSP